MVMDLSIQPPAVQGAVAAARASGSAAAVRQPSVSASASASASARPAGEADAGSTLQAAARLAASALYADRDVEVSSFHDEATGRMVHRIADQRSGQVLMQTPSEELLRFYASSRGAASPLVAIDA